MEYSKMSLTIIQLYGIYIHLQFNYIEHIQHIAQFNMLLKKILHPVFGINFSSCLFLTQHIAINIIYILCYNYPYIPYIYIYVILISLLSLFHLKFLKSYFENFKTKKS